MKKDNNVDDILTCPGFSKRLNEFLDHAGFKGIFFGRVVELAEIADMSRSGVSKWLSDDLPPKNAKLVQVCQVIIKKKRLTRLYNPKRVACWLEFGDEIIPNPFVEGRKPSKNHAVMGSLYVVVHSIAKSLDIDIFSLDSDAMDNLYNKLLESAQGEGHAEPDEKLVTKLLKAAQKETNKKQGH